MIDQKLRQFFDGKIVRKDLTKKIKEGANVPVYVLEFLLGQYCSSDDPEVIETGVENVKRILADNYVRPDEAQKILSMLRQRGMHTVIDKITVNLNMKKDTYEAEFSNLGIKNIPISEDYPAKFDRLLCGGIWCIVQLEYEFLEEEKNASPIHIRKLTPIQMPHVDIEELKEGRKNFTEEEWLEIMLRSCGYEPDKLNDRERWLLLARMLPLVENNFNLCELGPRSTGKSHIYKEISPNSILVSGGQTTVANLFYNMGRKTVGLVGLWDCVAFDEVAGINFKDKDGIQIMKDYMASGSFARGKEEKAATASMVFVGNINQSVDVLLKTSSLFDPFPPEMGTDTAFLDRMHCYIPGWEIPKFRPEHFTNDYGFITDYLAEFIRELRKEQYLTGGISLKAGDFVVVPIGDHQAEKLARVTEVFVCSTQNVPYPPEKTKFVLRKSERTAFPERTKPQHPAPKQADVSAPTESKRTVPPAQSAPIENPQKSAPTVQSAIIPPIVSQTPTELEITEKKSTLSKKPFPLGKLIAAVLAVAVIAGISISVSNRNKQRVAAYEAALQELSNGNYTSAEQDFSELSGYRDAASLSVYCKYADMYKDRTDYAGGQDELSNITLQYDTSWQPEVDALETRVKGYKAEKDAAEEAERQRIAAENAAKREQSLKDQYSGKLPVEGMPVSCLKYTSLGEPDKRLNCKNFEKLEQNQKYFNVYWYDENGEMIAAGMCAQWKNDSEYMLKSFSQYYPSGGDNGQTFNYGNGGSNSGSLRDDYDNPEDLWADNQDWYEDEDEAWDEWENG